MVQFHDSAPYSLEQRGFDKLEQLITQTFKFQPQFLSVTVIDDKNKYILNIYNK